MFGNPQPQGYLGNDFGPRDPIRLSNGEYSYPFHSGQDIGTSRVPREFFAIAAGVVVGTGKGAIAGRTLPSATRAGSPLFPSTAGNYVVLYHATSPLGIPLWSVYAHATSIAVNVGQRVGAGQLLGVSGATGGVKGLHLHLGIMTRPSSARDAHIDPRRVVDFTQDPRATLSGKPAPTKPVQEDDMSKTLIYRSEKSGETVVANVGAGLLFHLIDNGMIATVKGIPGALDSDETHNLGPIAFQTLCALTVEGQDTARKQAIFNRAIASQKAK